MDAVLRDYITEVDQLLDGFSLAMSGKVPSYYFPPLKLIDAINELDSQVPDSMRLALDNPFRETIHYYQLACRVFANQDNPGTFSLGVIIPMLSEHSDYIYEYKNNKLPFRVSGLELEIIPEK